MREFIAGLPKCELHLHVEGTLEPELKFELAARNAVGLAYATVDEMRAAYDFDDLPSFLACYYEGMSVLLAPSPTSTTSRWPTCARPPRRTSGYAEIFFDPQAHTSRGVPFDVVIGGLRQALTEAEAELGIRPQLIMCFLRDVSAESPWRRSGSLPYRD